MPSETVQAAFASGFAIGGALIVAIGAQNTFVLLQGLRREHVGAVVALCALADVLLMTLGVSGIAASFGAHPRALDAAALAGAVFLACYGAAAARRAFTGQALQVAAAGASRGLRKVLLEALAITLLNPHVYLDTVLLVGAVGSQQPPGLRPFFLAGAGAASVGWFAALGFGARLLAPLFARPAAWRVLDGLVALSMWAVAATLVTGVLR